MSNSVDDQLSLYKSGMLRFCVIAALCQFSYSLYSPYVSILAEGVFDSSNRLGLKVETWMGIFASMGPLAIILFANVSGKMIDAWGTARVTLASIYISCLAVGGYLISSSIPLLLISGFLDLAAVNSIYQAQLVGINRTVSIESRGKSQGIFFSTRFIGLVLAPPVGAWLAMQYQMKLAFSAGLVLFLISFMAVFFWLEREDRVKGVKLEFNFVRNIRLALRHPGFTAMGVIGMAMHMNLPALKIFFPLYVLDRFPGRLDLVGYLNVALGIGMVAQWFIGHRLDRGNPAKSMYLGCLLVVAGMASFFFEPGLFWCFVVALVVSIGTGIWNLSAWMVLGKIADEVGEHGGVVGSYMSVAKIGDLFASLTYGLIAGYFGLSYIFLTVSIFIVLAVVISIVLNETLFR